MTRKLDAQEPLLNTVARKLGRAAGTLANLTHKITTEQSAAPHTASESAPQGKHPASALQNRSSKNSQGTRKKRATTAAASRPRTSRTKSTSRRKA